PVATRHRTLEGRVDAGYLDEQLLEQLLDIPCRLVEAIGVAMLLEEQLVQERRTAPFELACRQGEAIEQPRHQRLDDAHLSPRPSQRHGHVVERVDVAQLRYVLEFSRSDDEGGCRQQTVLCDGP